LGTVTLLIPRRAKFNKNHHVTLG